MLISILIAAVAILAVLAIVIARQPAQFRVARTATLGVSPAVAFAQVNDFHKWKAWNPFDKADPAAVYTYEGSPMGVGAITSWAGNNKIGAGRMTILESRPHDLIRIKLEFFRPMAGQSTAEFTFKPQGNGTVVTWAMTGKNNFVAKALHLCVSMDKMIGKNFEDGLKAMGLAATGVAA